MSGLLYLAMVAFVTWYAWPAATTWLSRGRTFALAFWLPFLSWPWLIWRGVKARRHLKAMATAAAHLAEKQKRLEPIEWWLDEFEDALKEGDLNRAELARDVLATMDLTFPDRAAVEQYTEALNVLATMDALDPGTWPHYRDGTTGIRYTQLQHGDGRLVWHLGQNFVRLYVGNGCIRIGVPTP